MIKQITFHVPDGYAAEVVGFLYESDDPADLGQDMIEIRLPNGIVINSGWYPEGDPKGCYRIAVRTDGGLLRPPSMWDSAQCALEELERLVIRYCGPLAIANAGSKLPLRE